MTPTCLDGADDSATSNALDNLQCKILSEADSSGFVKMPSSKKIVSGFMITGSFTNFCLFGRKYQLELEEYGFTELPAKG